MRFIEAERPQHQAKPEIGSIVKPPIFNLDNAVRAKETAEKYLGGGFEWREFDSLRLAIALGEYNYLNALEDNKENERQRDRLTYKHERLVEKELGAKSKAKVLPTIGFEVEIPRIPFNELPDAHLQYTLASNAIGFPINRISTVPLYQSMWEFAPHPSFSADVQARIVSELIHAGWVASLVGTSSPVDILNNLDEKLVSFHINLGLPEFQKDLDRDPFKLLNFALAVGRTSPLRLARKSQTTLSDLKGGATVLPGGFGVGGRWEFKDFEIRTADTYRLMKEAQLVGAATIGASILGDEGNMQIWANTQAKIKRLTNLMPTSALITKKEDVSKVAEDPVAVQYMRMVLHMTSEEENKYLEERFAGEVI